MGTIKLRYVKKKGAAPDQYWLSKRAFASFSPSLLGLGDISRDGECFEAIAVIFDLQEFTRFYGQRDPQLEIPKFLRVPNRMSV